MLLMGKSTISMAIFNSKLLIYQRVMVLMDLLTGAVLNAGNFQEGSQSSLVINNHPSNPHSLRLAPVIA